MDKFPIRFLIVDDYEPWLRYFSTALRKEPGLLVVGEVSDGLEAIQKTQELQPDLILLDIGLPSLNGIEAARRIRKVSPASKILFASENRSVDIAEEALSTGAGGYILKSDAARELLPAVNAVLEGKRFVSANLADHDLNGPPDPQTGARFHRDKVRHSIPIQRVRSTRHHEAHFYSDDECFLNGMTQFVATALKAGSAVIVLATESHRKGLLPRLQAHGIDMTAAIQQQRYISFDSAEILSRFMADDVPDPIRFFKAASDLIDTASRGAGGASIRVVACGELAPLLLKQGKPESAIQLEQLWDQLGKRHSLDTLCTYSQAGFDSEPDKSVFQRICEQHSVVHSL